MAWPHPRVGAGSVQNVDPSSGCASSHGGASLAPISLVFMIDRSRSMKVDEDNKSTVDVRWNPVKAGLNARSLPAGPVRPPLVDATDAELDQLREDAAAAGVVL